MGIPDERLQALDALMRAAHGGGAVARSSVSTLGLGALDLGVLLVSAESKNMLPQYKASRMKVKDEVLAR